ncbi:mechanosensitive ion channel protein MscS, partial [Yoonia sp.]|nr:mechanosensitive ion channel protein MscS [Yoonia sp.]
VKLAIQAAGIVIPDATQAIEIKRERIEKPIELRESTLVGEVNATDDAYLERIVDAERGLESTEDLLREESLKE